MNPLLRFIILLLLPLPLPATAAQITVHNPTELRTALTTLKPGTHLKIAPGEYPGGHHLKNLQNLTIEALDPQNPPLFKDGNTAWQFSRCENLTLRHLHISGQKLNGINLDDGGHLDKPVSGITLEHLKISNIGPQGNRDAIKCSGLTKLTIRHCHFNGWGGSAIDFVGCHDSLITHCHFEGKDGYSAHTGIQLKGGTSDITIEHNQFINGGQRPINAGGSTGLAYFRPQGAKYEAKSLIIRHNTIQGSPCAIAFVGVDGAQFHHNTILFPTQWLFRILQETTEPNFAPCRNVIIKNNHFVYHRASLRSDINIGSGTQPETFQFDGNTWIAEDQPQASQPKLPTQEKNATYGIDPRKTPRK
ncbi:right-handed parallel beta-helix repeat-containing protein [Phragmitibacter flavus]|uniref:Right-handed parallel beta-helix repeat-containing protein n=1 Tax=Phragmitibacter flavus TaxID=2576071 RepID=A0A5R8K799_9BACT|nr:right-handed parallel beta-helix repeat-containing protein [Phragmitibacter flavus]TLD68241.1 right-handed parallel beta-helix repeat-containing protein [Phragmitibacter flavus]